MKNKFALVDCNNFYVSCEQVFNPKLLGKPVVVLSSNDACVIARSAQAKALGIPMGIPAFKCAELFKKHNVIIYSANFPLYGDISARVMQSIAELAADIEVYSVDEAFIHFPTLPHKSQAENDAFQLSCAKELRAYVKQRTGITVSIGLGPTKTLAKVANAIAKKSSFLEGVFDISHDAIKDKILSFFDIADIWGVGHRYAKLLKRASINTAFDFIQTDERWVRKNMTVQGHRTLLELRGIQCFSLADMPDNKKSICVSRAFGIRVNALKELKESVAYHASIAAQKLRAEQALTYRMSVFVIATPYYEYNRCYKATDISFDTATSYTPTLISAAQNAVSRLFIPGVRYIKTGVILYDLVQENNRQINLLDPISEEILQKQNNLMLAVDKVNNRWGRNKLFFAATGVDRYWREKKSLKSACFTTNWNELLTINI